MKTIAIFGAGNGGMSAAAHLSLAGHKIILCNRYEEELHPVSDTGVIKLKGVLGEHTAKVDRITTDVSAAVRATRLLFVIVPAVAHEFYAEAMSPYLTPEHIILLNPGSTGGALHFARILASKGVNRVPICETNTLTYACRITGPGEVEIFNLAPNVMAAVYPARETPRALTAMREAYPSLVPARNVLETSLSNLNAVIHPPGMVLNAGWIQRTKGDLYYYYDGTTPAVADVMRAIDIERVNIMKALGLKAVGFLQRFFEAGYTSKQAVDEDSFYIAFQESPPNRWLRSPSSLNHRYLDEDIRFGLVPMSEIGWALGVPTPAMDALITLGGIVNGADYRATGLTLERMGLDFKNISQLESILQNGA